MSNEIIFKCRSINNKNVRESELKMLEKREGELYFIIGENPANVKKRYYDDLKTLNEDYEELKALKEKSKANKNIYSDDKAKISTNRKNIIED